MLEREEAVAKLACCPSLDDVGDHDKMAAYLGSHQTTTIAFQPSKKDC